MSRRLRPTLTDYVVIAINPVMIMGLVGSLVFFLLEILYRGQYPDRLQFCLASFVFAIVLISRIAMEDGFPHAAPFGVALAVVVGLALNRYVDYHGAAIGEIGWIINWSLMALTWWCAHQITWDCTTMDESEEASGRGLLETAGIDKTTGEPEGSTPEPDSEKSAAPPLIEPYRTRWQDLLSRPDTRPHTPGVWIVYFSLASLPIFGLGQRLIPAENVASRRYAFILACVYVACGLGLLLTTSFLSIRRYLRQRKLEMPLAMVGNWLFTGGVMIVALLLLAALLPRPSPEFAISALPDLGSAERDASPVSVGGEGTKDSKAGQDSGVDHSPDPATDQSGQTGGADTRQPSGEPGGQAPGQSGSSSAGKNSPGSSGSKSEEKSAAGSGDDRSKDKSPGNDKQSAAKNTPKTEPQSQSGQQSQPAPKTEAGKPAAEKAAAPPPPSAGSPPPPPALPIVGSFFGELTWLLKWVFYAALVVGVAIAAWANRAELLMILHDWLAAIRDFWASLFGGQAVRSEDPAAEPARLEPSLLWSFADFVDPFAKGTAGLHPPADVVKYTFAALEVWAREQGCPRDPDQTPYEFAARLGGRIPQLSADAQALANLYGRAVYSTSPLPAKNVEQLGLLWRSMHAARAQQIAAHGI
jgi:Domain of unknown function (DUF4129)